MFWSFIYVKGPAPFARKVKKRSVVMKVFTSHASMTKLIVVEHLIIVILKVTLNLQIFWFLLSGFFV